MQPALEQNEDVRREIEDCREKKLKRTNKPLAVPRDTIERRCNGLHLPPSVKHRPRYL
jgi:hypothetical protein